MCFYSEKKNKKRKDLPPLTSHRDVCVCGAGSHLLQVSVPHGCTKGQQTDLGVFKKGEIDRCRALGSDDDFGVPRPPIDDVLTNIFERLQ